MEVRNDRFWCKGFRRGTRGATAVLLAVIVTVCTALAAASPAGAATPAAGWSLDSVATPSNFSAHDNTECLNSGRLEHCDAYRVTARNAGNLPSDGSTVTLAATLPAGLTVQGIEFREENNEAKEVGYLNELCTKVPLQCQLPTRQLGRPPIAPGGILEMSIIVTAQGALVR
jgi:hypothetical protein